MTKDTLTADENEVLIADMIRGSNKVENPEESTVLHKGDEDLPAPMVARKISGPKRLYVWNTRTYEKVPILYYMLGQKLRQRRLDGSLMFTGINPGKPFKMGEVKCHLHPSNENRAHYDDMGLKECKKENIINVHQLRLHMLKKHPQEWAAIEEERKDKEKQEDRDFQRNLLTRTTPEVNKVEEKKEKAPLYVSKKDKEKNG